MLDIPRESRNAVPEQRPFLWIVLDRFLIGEMAANERQRKDAVEARHNRTQM
jgi:hypothetical protein